MVFILTDLPARLLCSARMLARRMQCLAGAPGGIKVVGDSRTVQRDFEASAFAVSPSLSIVKYTGRFLPKLCLSIL